MEEIKQEWESFKKCTCRTFRDKCSNCMPQEGIADWWLKKLDLAVSKERERIVEVIKGATRKKKPTHGTCCTCQDCGYCNDYECECPRNNAIEEILSLINTK